MQAEVSIIIPTYNRTSYIKEAVDSVLNQTHPVYEILVIDDGSDESHKRILRSLESKSTLLKVVWLDENSGVSHARNRGVEIAKGDYILFLDDDDCIHPEMVETCLKTFQTHIGTEVVLAGGKLKEQDMSIVSHREKYVSLNTRTLLFLLHRQNHTALYFILYGMSLIHSFMFKREVLVKFPFDETLVIGEDTYQWMLLKKNGTRFRKIPLLGGIYRIHENQVSQTNKSGSRSYDYILKSMSLLSEGIEKSCFVWMNKHLIDEFAISFKKKSLSYPIAWVLVKFFMVTNQIQRGLLLRKAKRNLVPPN